MSVNNCIEYNGWVFAKGQRKVNLKLKNLIIMKKYLIKKLKALRQYFVSGSAIECEKHKWIKMANGRWCESCGKTADHFR